MKEDILKEFCQYGIDDEDFTDRKWYTTNYFDYYTYKGEYAEYVKDWN